MDPDWLPKPEERGALVPPRGTRPTAVGTATPPPPRPPRRWRRSGGWHAPRSDLWIVLAALGCALPLLFFVTILPVVALGGIVGGMAGMIGFARARVGRESRWLTVTAVGGVLGAALATFYWGESPGGASRSVTETLLMAGFFGMQVAVLGATLVACVGAFVAGHYPRWLARLVRARRRGPLGAS